MKKFMYRVNEEYIPTHYTNPNTFIIPQYPEDWTYVNINGIISYNYKVSTHGNVYSYISNRCITGTTLSNGYTILDLRTEDEVISVSLHRLVMMSFAPVLNMKDLEVNHKNGRRYNNNFYNLEWSTNPLNSRHSQEFNHTPHTLEDSKRVCELRLKGYNNQQISELMGWDYTVYNSTIKNIIYRSKDKYDFPILENKYSKKFTETDVRNICSIREKGKSINEIIDELSFENNIKIKDRIRNILRGRKWKNISDEYNFEQFKDQSTISSNDIENICKMYFIENKSVKEIMNSLNLDYSNRSLGESVRQICRGKSYKYISDKYINNNQTKQVE